MYLVTKAIISTDKNNFDYVVTVVLWFRVKFTYEKHHYLILGVYYSVHLAKYAKQSLVSIFNYTTWRWT